MEVIEDALLALECVWCQGTGQWATEQVYQSGPRKGEPKMEKCPNCGGTGEVR